MIDHDGGNIDADDDDDNIDDDYDLIDADDDGDNIDDDDDDDDGDPTLTEGVGAFSPLAQFSSGAPVHS